LTASLLDIPSGSFSFNADDELSSESYDQNGNVIASGGKTFGYDSQNELVTMASSGTAVSVVYDAFGNRVAKTANGVTTQYLVDDLNPTGLPQVFDELSGGAVTRTYTYGLQRIDEEQVISSAWTPSFYGYDGGGNVRTLTNTAGAITDSYEYDAFGNAWTVSGTTPNNYRYRGEQYDPDLGLYYLRARYYNPFTGRFMSRDPLSGIRSVPATLHKYLYAGGDPINLADPTGRAEFVEFGFTLVKTVEAGSIFAALGCGSQLGFMFAAGNLIKSLRDPIGDAYSAGGCAQMFIGPVAGAAGVDVTLGLNLFGLAACADGLIQMVSDMNQSLKYPSEALGNQVNYDFLNTETGCILSLVTVLGTP
jgi:RHS repeat-associated protein